MIFLLPNGVSDMSSMKMYPIILGETVLDVVYDKFVTLFNSIGLHTSDIGVYYHETAKEIYMGPITCVEVCSLMGDYPPNGQCLFCRFVCGPITFLMYAGEETVRQRVVNMMTREFGHGLS